VLQLGPSVGDKNDQLGYSRPFHPRPGKFYLWGAWVKSEEGNPHIFFEWMNANGKDLHYGIPLQGNVQSTWRRYAGVLLPPAETARVSVILENYRASGISAFDNLSWFEVDIPPDY
jgi:hypothetical protein